MDLVEIHPGLFLVPGANDGRYPYSHSILVDSDVVCLIDAGCGMAALEQVSEIASPDMLIATHAHSDHTAGFWMFDDVRLYVPIIGHETFGDIDLLAARFAGPGALAESWKSFVKGSMGFGERKASHTYDAGASFEFGQVRLVAIHTPGHTEDHMCFFDPSTGVLLTIDIDLCSWGPWYGNAESDISAFKQSIRSLMDLEPRIVVSSHCGIVRDDIQIRFQRYLDIIDMRHGAIAELLRQREWTLEELVDVSPFYRRPSFYSDLVRYWERQMIEKHLELLILENRVQRTSRGYISRDAGVRRSRTRTG